MWRWLYKFARRCNVADMMEAAEGRSALLHWSQDLYKDLVQSENIDCEWRDDGLLFVFKDKEHFDHYGETNELIQREFGVAADPYEGDQVVELEPSLLPGLGGGWHYRGDCHLRPDKLMASLKIRLQKAGVHIVESCNIEIFENSGENCTAVASGENQIAADHFVVATGGLDAVSKQTSRLRRRHSTRQGLFHYYAPSKDCPKDPNDS